jgi:hypothetical protein
MTAHSGRGWNLARSLIALEHEADTLAPHRNRASDGSIGDIAHSQRTSDHNVDDGWCHALDLTHDPAGGFDAHAHARRTAANRDPRIKYVISQRQIWDPARGWHPYSGTNPHDHHAHWSVWHTPAARDNLSPWLLTHRPDPLPPPPPPAAQAPGADMYIAAIGTGFFYQMGNVTKPITLSEGMKGLGEFAEIANGNKAVPTLTIRQADVPAWFDAAIRQTVLATTGKPLP